MVVLKKSRKVNIKIEDKRSVNFLEKMTRIMTILRACLDYIVKIVNLLFELICTEMDSCLIATHTTYSYIYVLLSNNALYTNLNACFEGFCLYNK